MKLILIRSPQLLFYRMKSKEKIKEHDEGYNYNFIQLQCQKDKTQKKSCRKVDT